jgi:hypothetical protein
VCPPTAELGVPVYLIADEVWYEDPDPARIASFDAVASYNMYDLDRMKVQPRWTLPEFGDLFVPAYERWVQQSRAVPARGSGRPVAFMPGVLPQFDDSAERGGLNPPVHAESRQQVVDLFSRARRLALENPDPDERFVWITSFNEWHEGTAIEPSVLSGAPFPGGNHGFELLEAVREAFSP